MDDDEWLVFDKIPSLFSQDFLRDKAKLCRIGDTFLVIAGMDEGFVEMSNMTDQHGIINKNELGID